jgi:hypothetical protein
MSLHIIGSIYHANFQSLLRYGIIFLGGDNEVLKYLNCKKRILRIMSGVSKRTSCREIFKDYSILAVYFLYIFDIIYYTKQHKQSLEQNAQIHKYDTWRRLDLYIHFCKTDLFRTSVINRGIRLHNKVPYYIKKLEKDKAFIRELRSFLLQQAFYLVDECMSF